MAHALSITDGTTTVNLSTTNAMLVQYTPVEAQPGEQYVSESVDLLLYAASKSALDTAVQTLKRLLTGIDRRREWGTGPAVYLNYTPDGSAATWRSEMVDYRFEYSEDALNSYVQAMLPATLILQRVPLWEGALTQIPLTNQSASNNTSGITVYNHDDSGTNHDCYVQIAAADVGGSLPAPVKIELTNNTGGSQNYKQIWLANNAFSDPANFPHILEGESFVAGSGTTGSNADSSGGSYGTVAVTGEAYQQWTLSSTLLTKARGYDFHLLARFRSVNGTVYIRPSVYEATGASTLWRGSETQVGVTSDAIIDLGTVPLPPGGYSTAYAAQRLNLAYRTVSTVTVQPDFLAWFPANTFRKLGLIGPQANGTQITDDQPEGRAYVVNSSAQTPAVVASGMPLMVWPNTLQRIYILHSLVNLSAAIDLTLSVKAWYRPRRASF